MHPSGLDGDGDVDGGDERGMQQRREATKAFLFGVLRREPYTR